MAAARASLLLVEGREAGKPWDVVEFVHGVDLSADIEIDVPATTE